MKPMINMKKCFASKDVCMAIKLCPAKAISYIEVDEPILDKTLNCNCNERETRGLAPMSIQTQHGGCGCVGGCGNGADDQLYSCGGTPYGRIIINDETCIRCGICAKQCCGDAIDMIDEHNCTAKKCACPKTTCPNHKKCCACVLKHKETDSLPFCLFLDNDGDKSIKHYYKTLKERFDSV